jgi:hypothetical protein
VPQRTGTVTKAVSRVFDEFRHKAPTCT